MAELSPLEKLKQIRAAEKKELSEAVLGVKKSILSLLKTMQEHFQELDSADREELWTTDSARIAISAMGLQVLQPTPVKKKKPAAPFTLTTEVRDKILSKLAHNEELAQKDVVTKSGLSPTTVKNALEVLEKENVVTRRKVKTTKLWKRLKKA